MTEPVLVLGAGGFIGRALATGLATAGIPVIAAGGSAVPPVAKAKSVMASKAKAEKAKAAKVAKTKAAKTK